MRVWMRMFAVLALLCLLVPAGLADGPAKDEPRDKDSSETRIGANAHAALPPAPQKSQGSSAATPKAEAFLGYSYVRVNASGVGANLNGGSANVAFNVNDWFGLVADFGGYHLGNVSGTPVSANFFSYLFGPRISFRRNERVTPFLQALFGGVRAGGAAFDTSGSVNSFGWTGGGGMDVKLSRKIAWRIIQAEYLMTRFGGETQNNARISSGIVFRLGEPKPAPPPSNHPPIASCSAERSSVYVGSGDVVTVRAQASDPDNDPLTYTWTASGGRVDGAGPEVRWNSAGTAEGSYTITSRVDDGRGGTASCSADIRVEARPNRPPTLSCSAERSSVLVGERVAIIGRGSDPDGDNLTYTWRASGGQIVGSGANVQLDTSGLAPGSYTVTGRADDGRGGAADCTATVNVEAPPPAPTASKINECLFKPAGSSRVDNVCKRVLDDVALRLQNDPRSSLVIVGYADPKERQPAKLSEARGKAAVKYLGEKGVDASRVNVRSASGQAGAGDQNRRIDIVWVPQGATY